MSAVSKKVMPASNVAFTTAAVPAASRREPKLLQPNPTTDTASDPILRVSMPVPSPLEVDLCGVGWLRSGDCPAMDLARVLFGVRRLAAAFIKAACRRWYRQSHYQVRGGSKLPPNAKREQAPALQRGERRE